MKKRYLILLAISGIIICLDQITKMYVHTHFTLHESISVIKDYFDITYIRNEGAAFGFLANTAPTFRDIFFLSMPPIALLVILSILRSVPDDDILQISALSLVFGGAIGNYIDRVRFGWVIDFLDFYYEKYHWPAFNVADMSIVLGISVLLLLMFKNKQPQEISVSPTTS